MVSDTTKKAFDKIIVKVKEWDGKEENWPFSRFGPEDKITNKHCIGTMLFIELGIDPEAIVASEAEVVSQLLALGVEVSDVKILLEYSAEMSVEKITKHLEYMKAGREKTSFDTANFNAWAALEVSGNLRAA